MQITQHCGFANYSIHVTKALPRQLYEAAAAIVPDEQVEVAFDE